MEGNFDNVSLLTAIVPIRPSVDDFKNVISWLNYREALKIHFVLILDRPNAEIKRMAEDLVAGQNISPYSPKVDIVQGNFAGPGRARNAGLPFIDSQYVAFWDSDDYPNIPKIIHYLSRHQVQDPKLLVGSFEILRSGKDKQILQTNNHFQLARNPGLWRCLVPAGYIKAIEFPDILLGEDQVFLAKIIAGCPPIEFIGENFYSYVYGNSSQLTSTRDYSDLIKAETLLSEIDLTNTKKNERDFIYNLSTKQLLTMLIRGRLVIKLISILRIYKKLSANFWRESNSIKEMIRNPRKERFNG